MAMRRYARVKAGVHVWRAGFYIDSDARMKAADVAAKYRVSGSWVQVHTLLRRRLVRRLGGQAWDVT